jgi:hypothetical protein
MDKESFAQVNANVAVFRVDAEKHQVSCLEFMEGNRLS